MKRGRASAIGLVLTAAMALSGCAYISEDADGSRRIIGFVDVALPPVPPDTPIAGQFVSVRSLGVTVTDTPDSSGLVVGYADQSFASLRDGVLVDGHPLRPMQPTPGIAKSIARAQLDGEPQAAPAPVAKKSIKKKRFKRKHARRYARR